MAEPIMPKLDCEPYFKRRHASFKYGIPMAGIAAFDSHKRSAKRRGIDFLFTLPGWWAWWQIDGRWERRGRGKDKLCMARKGDAGPYSAENVYCATNSQNHADVPVEVWRTTGSQHDLVALAARNRERCGAKHHASRPVITPLGRFDCAADASRAHGIHPGSGRNKARLRQTGWRYADD